MLKPLLKGKTEVGFCHGGMNQILAVLEGTMAPYKKMGIQKDKTKRQACTSCRHHLGQARKKSGDYSLSILHLDYIFSGQKIIIPSRILCYARHIVVCGTVRQVVGKRMFRSWTRSSPQVPMGFKLPWLYKVGPKTGHKEGPTTPLIGVK